MNVTANEVSRVVDVSNETQLSSTGRPALQMMTIPEVALMVV